MVRRQLYQTVAVASVALHGGLKDRLPPGLPCKNSGEYKKQSDIERTHEPSCSPPGVHALVHLLVDLVRLLIIRFVSGSSEESVLIVWVLKLFRVYFRVFSSSSLSFSVEMIRTL